MKHLYIVFPQRWFTTLTWPDTKWFFWGVVKNKVYEKNPKTVNELKDYIHDIYKEIDKNRN